MLTKSSIVKLMIAALIIVPCCNSITEEDLSNMIDEAKYNKPPRCLAPNCGGTIDPHPDLVLSRWVFNAFSKSCIPFYMPPEHRNFDCPSAFNLPQTKKECEDMCGEPCIVTYPNKVTEPGICMSDCHIQVPQDVPLPCPPYFVRCCPRDYINLPNSTTN